MNDTTRFVGFLVISTFFLFSAIPLALGEVSSIFYLSTSTNRVKIGETFDLYVVVNSTESIGALDLEVDYPSELLSLISVKALSSGALMQFNDKDGSVRVSIVSLSGIPSGKFLLIRFKGKSKGIANIKLKILEATTPDVQELSFSTMNSTIEVLVLPIHSSTTSTASSTSPSHIPSSVESSVSTVSTTTQTSQNKTPTSTSCITTSESSEASTTTTSSGSPVENGTETKSTPPQSSGTTQTHSNAPPEAKTTSPVTTSYPPREWVPVFISSRPEGAEVYLDGKFLGTTPIKIELPPGVYNITAVLNSQKEDRLVEIKHSEEDYTVTFKFSVNTSNGHETSSNGKICGPGSIILVLILSSSFRRR